jgi:hypothetical protein
MDCSDVDTAIACLAEAMGVDVDQLSAAVLAYDEAKFSDYSEDPYKRMPREILEGFGITTEAPQFAGVYYFHGTRLIGLEGIGAEGVLPLDQMVERTRTMLYSLVTDECDQAG